MFYSRVFDVSLSQSWGWQETLQSGFHVEGSAAEASMACSKRPMTRITAEKKQKSS